MRRFHQYFAAAMGFAGGMMSIEGEAKAGYAEADAIQARSLLEAATTRLDAEALEVQVKLNQIETDRQLRDLNVNRQRTTSRVRAILASTQGEGLSSQLSRVVLGETEGEFATAEERLVQDNRIQKDLLQTRAENLRRIAQYTEDTGGQAASDLRSATRMKAIGATFGQIGKMGSQVAAVGAG